MPEPPASVIQNDDFGAFIADPEVEYVSTMAMALEQNQLSRFNDLVASLAPLAQQNPEWFARLDPDFITQHFMRLQGLPVRFARDDEQMAAMAAAAQQEAQMQQAQMAAEAVGKAGGIEEVTKAAKAAQQ